MLLILGTRKFSILIFVSVIMSIGIGSITAAWFILPSIAPKLVCAYSPWIDPVWRAAIILENHGDKTVAFHLMIWAKWNFSHSNQLIPYFKSSDPYLQTISIVTFQLIHARSTKVDLALIDILENPDPHFRSLVVQSLGLGALPWLVARAPDPDPQVRQIISERIRLLEYRKKNGEL